MKAAIVTTIAAGLAAAAMLAAPVAAEPVVTKQYDDGGVYEGTFRNGRQHGQGSYTLPSGYRYEGDWVDGQIVGQGRATYPNGSTYEGHFDAGKPNGTGRITYADGGTYEVWRKWRINAPSILGTATFPQYWSVRTKRHTGGTVNTTRHFEKWAKAGLPLGKQRDGMGEF